MEDISYFQIEGLNSAYQQIHQQIEAEFPEPTAAAIMLPHKVIRALRLAQYLDPDPKKIAGKRVVDLGCGSASSGDGLVLFNPVAARVFHRLGADVLGVDLADNSWEPFASLQLDLSSPDADRLLLAQVPESSADLVINTAFSGPSNPSTVLTRSVWDLEIFRSWLRRIVHHLLQPKGWYREDGQWYTKQGLAG